MDAGCVPVRDDAINPQLADLRLVVVPESTSRHGHKLLEDPQRLGQHIPRVLQLSHATAELCNVNE